MTDNPEPTSWRDKLTPRISGIIWGAAKTGKTTYAFSSPGRKWHICLDPEGYIPIMYRDDVGDVWDYSDMAATDVITHLTTKIAGRIAEAPIASGDTVIFDSVTLFNSMALEEAIRKNVGAGNGFTPTLEAPGLAAYGARTQYLNRAMSQVSRAARKKNAHIWFLAHEDTPEKDKKGDFLYQSILMSENAINNASAAISEIWRLTSASNSRSVWVRSTSSYRPMGSRIFRMDEGDQFKLKYDIDKPDDVQPMAIANIWQKWLDGGGKKISLPA